MALAEALSRSTVLPNRSVDSKVVAQRLEQLRFRIERSVTEAAGGVVIREDELLTRTVTASIDAFIDADTDPHCAANAVSHLMDLIGERQARRGFGTNELDTSFRVAMAVAQKGLVAALGNCVAHDTLVRLREALVIYLSVLHRQARASLLHTNHLIAMSPEQRHRRFTAAVFGGDASIHINKIAALEGFDPTDLFLVVVSVEIEIPAEVRNHPRTISGSSFREALVPKSWGPYLPEHLEGQAVTGPAVHLAHVADAIALARQAAAMVREGTVIDPRPLVPYVDLLGDLLVGGNRLLTELIFNKHLARFEDLPLQRRLDLAELLLNSLESGQSMNHVARDLGIPPQTAHSRMKTLRAIFGDDLKDPTLRLELIVALRSALPRWRASR